MFLKARKKFIVQTTKWDSEHATPKCAILAYWFSSVQLLSHVWLFATPWTAAHQPSLSITNSQSLLRLRSIESVMHSNHFILCHPVTSSSCLQPLPASGSFQMSQFFASGGQSIGVSISNISPSNDYSGLISFRMDWLDLLAVQGTLKSLQISREL